MKVNFVKKNRNIMLKNILKIILNIMWTNNFNIINTWDILLTVKSPYNKVYLTKE